MDPIFLSHVAVRLRDTLAHHRVVTAALVLSTLQSILERPGRVDGTDHLAVQVARSLQNALFLHDLDWKGVPIRPDTDPSVLYAFSSTSEELPAGIVTAAGDCYSPLCQLLTSQGNPSACYAFDCPRRFLGGRDETVRPPITVDVDDGEIATRADTLAHQVRELVEGEQAYYDDLCLVETAFAQPLRAAVPPIIAPSRLETFLDDALLNLAEVREHSRRFLASLKGLDCTAATISDVSQVVQTAAASWAPAYLRFTAAFPVADNLLRREKSTNPAFAAFLDHFHNHPSAARRGFDTFHSRPTFRALRYKLLLEGILHSSSPSDVGRPQLLHAIEMLGEQSSAADVGVGEAKRRMAVRGLENRIRFKNDTEFDLQITSATYLEKEGSVFLRDSTGSWRPAHLFLLDNFLVLAKAPRMDRDGYERYTVKQRPIPLDLLQVLALPAAARAENLTSVRSSHQDVALAPSTRPTQMHAIRCQVAGPHRQSLDFYVESREEADGWRTHIDQAISTRRDRRCVQLNTLLPAAAHDCRLVARIQLAGHPELLVTGGLDGLFVGWTEHPPSHRRVVHLLRIKQLETHTPSRTLFVLAAGVLLAYPFDALIPTVDIAPSPPQKPHVPIRVSGRETVTHFTLRQDGNGKTAHLAYSSAAGHDTILRLGHFLPGSSRQTVPPSTPSLKLTATYSVPSRIQDFRFLGRRLTLIREGGLDILDPESGQTLGVPNLLPLTPSAAASFARYTEHSTVLALVQLLSARHLLICHDVVSVIGSQGEPNVPPLFRWYLQPLHIAMLGDSLVGAGPQGLEIRSISSGALISVTNLPFCGLGTTEDGSVYAVRGGEGQQEICVVVST